jgi:hypothetical protein
VPIQNFINLFREITFHWLELEHGGDDFRIDSANSNLTPNYSKYTAEIITALEEEYQSGAKCLVGWGFTGKSVLTTRNLE